MKRLLLITALVLMFSLMVTGVAFAADGDDNSVTTGEVALVLAPLVAAATAIERFIEMVFDGYESLVLGASDFLGKSKGYLGWAKQQVRGWQDAFAELQKRKSRDAAKITEAENAIADAQDRLVGFLKSPFYTSRKRVLSLIAGIVLGVIVAYGAKLRMLAMVAGIFGIGGGTGAGSAFAEVGRGVDMLLTGLIIGTGSAPVHSLIGLLQNTKDAVDKVGTQWAGNARLVGVEANDLLQKTRETVSAPLPAPVESTRAFEEEEEEEGEPVLIGDVEMERRINRLLR
jgi:hypothetical protein